PATRERNLAAVDSEVIWTLNQDHPCAVRTACKRDKDSAPFKGAIAVEGEFIPRRHMFKRRKSTAQFFNIQPISMAWSIDFSRHPYILTLSG
ncbi:MAG: hypothetical protein KBH51_00340, partial [Synergistales bacterium]|nr:hypothetical protein [Synergistales bacterium]